MNNWNGTIYIPFFFLSLFDIKRLSWIIVYFYQRENLFSFCPFFSRCRAPIIFNKTVELQLCSVHFNFIMFN